MLSGYAMLVMILAQFQCRYSFKIKGTKLCIIQDARKGTLSEVEIKISRNVCDQKISQQSTVISPWIYDDVEIINIFSIIKRAKWKQNI